MSVRDARLKAELEAMQGFGSDVVQWKPIGGSNPPDRYQLFYDLTTIVNLDQQGNPILQRKTWTVEIVMPPNYPWGKPQVGFVGERVYHPNVWLNGDICIEDHYKAGIGIPLDSLCEHIGQIISYQKYNLNSPANPDPRLRTWIIANGSQKLPTDQRDIRRARIEFGSQPQGASSVPKSTGSRIKFGS